MGPKGNTDVEDPVPRSSKRRTKVATTTNGRITTTTKNQVVKVSTESPSTTSNHRHRRHEEEEEPPRPKWPICTLSALFLTTASIITIVTLAALGWPFESYNRDCYNKNFRRHPGCFCEKIYGKSPSDVWIAQPANTLSNLAFNIVGFMVAYCCDYQYPKIYWKIAAVKSTNPMKRHRGYGALMACILCFMGAGSAMYHASLTSFGAKLDLFSMYLIGAFMVPYSLTRKLQQLTFGVFLMPFGVLVGLSVFLTLNQTETYSLYAIYIMLGLPLVVEVGRRIGYYCCITTKRDTADLRYLLAATMCMAVAKFIWMNSKRATDGPLCFPKHWFQGHALWHVLCAISLGLVFMYGLSSEDVSIGDQVDDDCHGGVRKTSDVGFTAPTDLLFTLSQEDFMSQEVVVSVKSSKSNDSEIGI